MTNETLKRSTAEWAVMEPTRPRVALVAHNIHDRGGMERGCAELIRQSCGQIDFYVVSSELSPQLRPLVLKWQRVSVPRRPFPMKFMVFWFRAGCAIRQLDADLVHTVGAIVPNRVDLATIAFCHAGYIGNERRLAPEGLPSSRRFNTALSRVLALLAEQWTYRPSRLRAFAAVSNGVADELVRHYPRVPCAVTPNGVDLLRFRPDSTVRAEHRMAAGTSHDTTVALFVGGDWHHKGLSIVIPAVAAARASGQNVELWVVGKGDQRRFERLSRNHGIKAHVRFYGPRYDIERFYQAADVFVLPSAYETFSLVCFEAAACGLPLLIPPISGASEIVGDNTGGRFVERSISSVTDALIRVAADPAARLELGMRARARAQAFGWDRSAESVTKLYRELLASPGWGQTDAAGALPRREGLV
jgi:glycosyltransferase involved in cell wall biosynthesis